MQTNQAFRIHSYGGPEVLQRDDMPMPVPGAGQVLIRVKAAGVNGLDWKIRDGLVRDAFPLPLPAVLGIELAGEVVATAPNAARFKTGDRVMGALGGLGAYADFTLVDEAKLCLIPAALGDVEAAALPVAALTAWQVLRASGPLHPGQKILIQGAAGGVGGFAVQFAKAAGATVFATAAGASRAHVLGLGADVVIDRLAERFEDKVDRIDLIIDLVGGETLDRSWAVLAADGVIVSTAAPDIAQRAPVGRRGVWFMMTPDAAQLAQIADQVATGRLKSTIAETIDRIGLADAIERSKRGHAPGKIVLDLTRS